MLCDKCKKNEAKVYYTEIVNDEKSEQHLCEDCAMEVTSFQMGNTFMKNDITLGNLLSTILGNYYNTESKEKSQEQAEPSCSTCGLTYKKLMKTGRFGCSHCYDNFAQILDKSIMNIQGSNHHTGKQPKRFIQKQAAAKEEAAKEAADKESLLQEAISKEALAEQIISEETPHSQPDIEENIVAGKGEVNYLQEIEQLKVSLQHAIKVEEYEEAARLRDRIRLLKKGEMNNA